MSSSTSRKVLRKADPSSIHDKFLVGYQGWFTCKGDGAPLDPHHHGWLHWFTQPIPDGGRPNTDLWPDTQDYSPSELYPAPGLKYKDGSQAFLFSSRHPKTVQRHFHWMAMHGVDGAFLQRFLGQCDVERGSKAMRNQRDEIGDRVREAAEQENRVFAIMYDVTGVETSRIQQLIQNDWLHLVHDKRILDSPSYLRQNGKPVISLWGFGFSDRDHSPAMVRAITQFFRANTPGGAYIIAGTPAYWRTSRNDAHHDKEWVDVWLEEFDAISPWTVGRYTTLEDMDRFGEEVMKGDADLIKKRNEQFDMGTGGGKIQRKVDYIPVVLPGASGFNLSEGKWSWNGIPRRGGNFLWRQLFNARRLNARTVYGAMWDEYDEGTAFMPIVQNKRMLPVHDKFNFTALDEDGFDLPPDWYMRICGFAVEGLRGERMIHETFPNKELQDYWSSRPRYEEELVPSSSSSSLGHTEKEKQADKLWNEWDKAKEGLEDGDEPPPPPYTLEADEIVPAPQVTVAPLNLAPRPSTSTTRPLNVSHRAHQEPASTSSARPINSTRPPPSPSLTTRPPVPPVVPPDNRQVAPTSVSAPTSAPPPINLGRKPTQVSSKTAGKMPQTVDGLANDFRTGMNFGPNPSSPNHQAPPRHPSRPSPSSTPISSPPSRPTTLSPPPLHPSHSHHNAAPAISKINPFASSGPPSAHPHAPGGPRPLEHSTSQVEPQHHGGSVTTLTQPQAPQWPPPGWQKQTQGYSSQPPPPVHSSRPPSTPPPQPTRPSALPTSYTQAPAGYAGYQPNVPARPHHSDSISSLSSTDSAHSSDSQFTMPHAPSSPPPLTSLGNNYRDHDQFAVGGFAIPTAHPLSTSTIQDFYHPQQTQSQPPQSHSQPHSPHSHSHHSPYSSHPHSHNPSPPGSPPAQPLYPEAVSGTLNTYSYPSSGPSAHQPGYDAYNPNPHYPPSPPQEPQHHHHHHQQQQETPYPNSGYPYNPTPPSIYGPPMPQTQTQPGYDGYSNGYGQGYGQDPSAGYGGGFSSYPSSTYPSYEGGYYR